MAISLTFKTFVVLINGEKKTFRATSEENAEKNAKFYCKVHEIKNATIKVVSIAP